MSLSKKYFIIITAVVGFFTLLPLIALMKETFFQGEGGLSSLIVILSKAKTYQLIYQSLKLSFFVVALVLIIAIPLAFIMTKTRFRHWKWLDTVFILPFMTPPYIGAMGWILFMQKNGLLMQLFPSTTNLSEKFFSLGGMVFIMSLHLFPTLYLMIKNSLLNLERSFQDAAKIYEKNSFFSIIKINLPLLVPSILLASLLVFVKTLSEFGTPITFGTRIGYKVFTTEIHAKLSSWPVDISSATLLSFILFVISMVIWYIQVRIVYKSSYGISGNTNVSIQLTKNNFTTWLSGVYILAIMTLSLIIPYSTILLTSLMKVRGGGITWTNVSFDSYRSILLENAGGGLSAFGNSLTFAIATTIITSFIGFFASVYIYKGNKMTQKFLDFLGLLPNIVPGIVLVIGLIFFWNAPWLPYTVYNTRLMVVVTYSALFLPYTIQYIKSSMLQLPNSIFEATSVFERNAIISFLRVYFPLLRNGLLTGAMLTFIISMRELVGSLLILPPSVETGATFIYRQFEQGNASVGMAMATITSIVTCIFVTVIERMKFKIGEHSEN